LVAGRWPVNLICARHFALPLLSLSTALMLVQPGTATAFEFENTDSLATRRAYHTATLLQNGKVLIVGGSNWPDGPLASAELYDPVSGTWSLTGSLATARQDHAATLLPNGKVLVAGGYNRAGPLA